MKYANLASLLIASTLCCLAIACDGDDNNNGGSSNTNNGGPSSGVASDKTMSSLVDAEIAQVNTAIGTYMAQQMSANLSKDVLCEFSGVMMASMSAMLDSSATDASIQQSCSSTAQQCAQSSTDPSQAAAENQRETTQVTKADLSDCTATVAEYEACMKDTTAATITMMKSLPKCTDLKSDSLESSMTTSLTYEQPVTCQSFATKCPGYAATESTDTAS